MSRELLNYVAAAVTAALLCLGFGVPTLAATEKYQAYLSPMPYSNAMRPNVTGKGNVVAILDGDTMSLSGAFTGVGGVATKAHVYLSKAPGIPGTAIFEVTVPSGVEGKVTRHVQARRGSDDRASKGQAVHTDRQREGAGRQFVGLAVDRTRSRRSGRSPAWIVVPAAICDQDEVAVRRRWL
jgi:hypothetical protein